ncbi:MAG: serine/threonine-protein kinase [Planctomycetota bacterium]
MLLPFQRDLEERLLARSPGLDRAVPGIARAAWTAGASGIDLLLERGLLSSEAYREACSAAGPLAALLPWGPFEVTGELGRGACGVVYRASWRGRPAALKVLRREVSGHAPARFAREAALLARLEHPGIVALLEAGEHEGARFIATELHPRGSLADLRLPLPLRAALALALELCAALAYAHARGVLHRDLKPANVLLALDGSPRLVDLGLAKELGAEPLTGSCALLGSPRWAAPEQLGGAASVDARADVYGLAALLHALLCGEPPFAARTMSELFRAHLRGPAPLPEVPGLEGPARAALSELLERALSPRPELRPESITALAGELARCARLARDAPGEGAAG